MKIREKNYDRKFTIKLGELIQEINDVLKRRDPNGVA